MTIRHAWKKPNRRLRESLIDVAFRHDELADIYDMLGWPYPDNDVVARHKLLDRWDDNVRRCVLDLIQKELQ